MQRNKASVGRWRTLGFPHRQNGRPSRRKIPFDGRRRLGRQVSWLAGRGRAFGLPGCPVALYERRLAAHSCGDSRGFPPRFGSTAFPFNPAGGTVLADRVTAETGGWQ